MDVSYLLWLQSLRESTGGVLDSFFMDITTSGLLLLYFLGGVMFWCVSKKAGACMMMACHFGAVVNQLIKNTCCVYRPWIHDARIHPAGNAISTAPGYSFPSGHTQLAFSGYGSLAVSSWNRNRALAVVLVLFAALIAFSRNYLGVHFGSDVLVGIVESCVVIWAVHWLLTWCERSRNADLWILLGGVLFVAAVITYVALKSYPMDYDAEGKLLVDPVKMAQGTYRTSAGFIGFLLGWIIERRWIRLNVEVSIPWRIVRGVVGCALLLGIYHLPLGLDPDSLPCKCLRQFLVLFFCSGLYPALLQGIASLGRPAPKKEAEAPAAE